MKSIVLFILTIFIIGCGTTSKIAMENELIEKNKDVFILTTLIRDYLRKTKRDEINLNEILQYDTLKRISNNFEKLEVEYKGNIVIYYKFSSKRNSNIELNTKEREEFKHIILNNKNLNSQFDGEIQFDYGERFYRIRKIKITKHQ